VKKTPFLHKNLSKMIGETVKLVLNVEKSKKDAFLQMLKLFEFVEVESNADFLKRFVENAPVDVPFSDEEIADFVTEIRYQKITPSYENHL
jgi:hypothetical protein